MNTEREAEVGTGQPSPEGPSKKPYTSPKLMRYGDIARLTKTGSAEQIGRIHDILKPADDVQVTDGPTCRWSKEPLSRVSNRWGTNPRHLTRSQLARCQAR